MVSTRQQARTRKPIEETPPSTGNRDEHEEQTPNPRKTRGKKRAETLAGGRRQQNLREEVKLSRFPNLPIDILYEVRRSLHAGVFPDTTKFPDIFLRPPRRSNADLLDLKEPQQIPYKQVIAPRLAGCFRDDPEDGEATTLPFRDYRNGLRETFVQSTLHGLYIVFQPARRRI